MQDSLKRMAKLTHLHMEDNKISEIPRKCFTGECERVELVSEFNPYS